MRRASRRHAVVAGNDGEGRDLGLNALLETTHDLREVAPGEVDRLDIALAELARVVTCKGKHGAEIDGAVVFNVTGLGENMAILRNERHAFARLSHAGRMPVRSGSSS